MRRLTLVVVRCAWHRQLRRWPSWLPLPPLRVRVLVGDSEPGLVMWSDGLCGRCAATLKAQVRARSAA